MSGYEADRGVYTTENKNSNLKLNTNDTGGGRVFYREMKASPLYAVKVNTADLLDFIKKNPHAMESLGTALLLKPYADIDKTYDTEEARALNEVSDYTRAREAFEELFNEDMIALSGCGYSSKKEKYINSFHFVCNGGELYADPLEIKEIIKDELPDYKELGYDLAVYHKAGTPSGMRAPYAVKKGENRRLELVEGIEGGRLITKDICEVSNDLYECMLITTAEHNEITNTRPAEVKNTDININKLFEAVPVLKHEAGAHTIKDISEAETDEGLMKTYKLKRLTPTLCHLCERIHEADNTLFILQFANGAKLAGCWKQKQDAEIKGESARYISLTAGNATYADKVKFYIKTANENRQAIQQREAEELTEKLNILGADIINTKEAFCSNIKEFMEEQSKPTPMYDIIAIKSGLGTGKTTANSKVITGLISNYEEIAELTKGTIKKNASEVVEKLKNNPLARDIIEKHKDNPAEAVLQLKQMPRFKSVVSSYRRTLASDYKSKYPLNADYRDEPKGKLKKDNLTIQADSFYRIPISREPINKLVIDEADQFVKHLTSDTFKKSRNNKNNWEIVKYVIGTAKQIIVMSGTIKADDVEFFQNIRRECGREAKTLFINNDISAVAEITKTKRNIHIKTGNIGEAYEQIVKLRSEGKKVLVPANIGKRTT